MLLVTLAIFFPRRALAFKAADSRRLDIMLMNMISRMNLRSLYGSNGRALLALFNSADIVLEHLFLNFFVFNMPEADTHLNFGKLSTFRVAEVHRQTKRV